MTFISTVLDIATIVAVVFWICSGEPTSRPMDKEAALYTGRMTLKEEESE